MIIELITSDWEDIVLEDKKSLVEIYSDTLLEDLDKSVVQSAVNHIKVHLSIEGACQIAEEFEKYGVLWFAKFHYRNFGLQARNMLRDFVCDDDELPTGDWEDYYFALFEVALGLRKIDGINI